MSQKHLLVFCIICFSLSWCESLLAKSVTDGQGLFDIDENDFARETRPEWEPAHPPTTNSATTAPNGLSASKLPIPPLADRQRAGKLAEEIFGAECKDPSPSARRFLTNHLIQEADKSTCPGTDRFVMLTGALRAAEDTKDLELCFRVIDALGRWFDVDLPGLQMRSALNATIDLNSSEKTTANCTATLELVDHLVVSDRLGEASHLLSFLARSTPTNDPSLNLRIKTESAKLDVLNDARGRLEKAMKQLRASPSDPAANLAVGRFLCFYLGAWDQGLPMLRKSNDRNLKELSSRELSRPSDSHGKLAIGDGWWDICQKERGVVQEQTRSHACTWYTSALPGLTGLDKAKVETRLAQSPATPQVARIVDLLALIDPSRDTVQGKFAFQNGELESIGKGQQRIEVRYIPPEEYDFEIEFTRFAADGPVIQILSKQATPFIWVMETKDLSFHYFKGAGDFTNATTVRRNNAIVSGMRYRSLVQVRNGGVRAFLNGILIKELQTDYTNFNSNRPFWLLRNNSFIGLGVVDRVVFYSAKVTEVTGTGRMAQ